MKPKHLLYTTAALGILLLAACTDNDSDATAWNNEILLTSSVEEAETRSTDQTLQGTQIEVGNTVGVFITDASSTTSHYSNVSLTAGANGALTSATTMTYPTDGSSVNIFAYAPYAASYGLGSGNTFSVQTDQSADEDYIASDLLYGTPSSNPVSPMGEAVPLVFKHKLTKINVTLTTDEGSNINLTGATLTLTGVQNQADFNTLTGELGTPSGNTASIVMATLTATDASASAVLLPQTFTASSSTPLFSLTLSGGNTYTYTPSADITFSGNEQHAFTLYVEPAGETLTLVSQQISPWTNGTTTTGTTETSGTIVYKAIVDASYTGTDGEAGTSGVATYKTVQAAVNAATNATAPYPILILNGTYNECVNISNPYIHLIGQDRDNVNIQFALNRVCTTENGTARDNVQGSIADDVWKYSIYNQSSTARKSGYTNTQYGVVMVTGTDFYAENVSFINLYGAAEAYGGEGRNGQAEALITRKDRTALNNCRLISYQDTWWSWMNSSDRFRIYAYNCYIEGCTDYVWGHGDLLIENSTFHNVGAGFITAPDALQTGICDMGFVIKDCTVEGTSGFYFGRPYRTGCSCVWINTELQTSINSYHWTSMSSNVPTLLGEYNTTYNGSTLSYTPHTFSGEISNSDGSTTKWSFTPEVLSASEAAQYTYSNMIYSSDWNPKEYMQQPATPSGLAIADGRLTWNASHGASCYLVFDVDGDLLTITTSRYYDGATSDSTYTVVAANSYGSLGEAATFK